MTKTIIILALIAAAGLFGGAWYWASHPPAYVTDPSQLIDHHFVVAAYTVAWVVQLGYLILLGLRWSKQKKEAARLGDE